MNRLKPQGRRGGAPDIFIATVFAMFGLVAADGAMAQVRSGHSSALHDLKPGWNLVHLPLRFVEAVVLADADSTHRVEHAEGGGGHPADATSWVDGFERLGLKVFQASWGRSERLSVRGVTSFDPQFGYWLWSEKSLTIEVIGPQETAVVGASTEAQGGYRFVGVSAPGPYRAHDVQGLLRWDREAQTYRAMASDAALVPGEGYWAKLSPALEPEGSPAWSPSVLKEGPMGPYREAGQAPKETMAPDGL